MCWCRRPVAIKPAGPKVPVFRSYPENPSGLQKLGAHQAGKAGLPADEESHRPWVVLGCGQLEPIEVPVSSGSTRAARRSEVVRAHDIARNWLAAGFAGIDDRALAVRQNGVACSGLSSLRDVRTWPSRHSTTV